MTEKQSHKLVAAHGKGPRAATKAKRVFNNRVWLFLIPAGIYLAALSIYPLSQLFRLAFSDVKVANLYKEWPSTGFDNFIEGFRTGVLTESLVRTLFFVLVVTTISMVGGVAVAIAMRRSGKWSSWLLAVMVFVWALPPVINGSVWKFLLAEEGLINSILRGIGLDTFPFLYDERFALISIALVNSWAIIPFNALVFRASVLNVDPELFEAAQLDGTRPSQELRYILLPLLKPTALVLLVLTIVNAFRSFDFIYVMTRGGPGVSTQTLPYLSFQQAFVGYDFSAGAVTSVLSLVMVLILAVVYARAVFREES